ncbi:MAG: hypothetical protein HQK89_08475 [Nitrospirae bacterium]|nr:hypothetical protein [Nitrospirota bacterium]
MAKKTLLNIESKLKQAGPGYFGLYQKLAGWVKNVVWATRHDVFEQLNHDTGHSRRLLEYIDVIIRDKFGKKKDKPDDEFFSAGDLFLIASSVYLHDIGMQRWKERFPELDRKTGLSNEDRTRIRNEHAATSSSFIRRMKVQIPADLEVFLTLQEKSILQDKVYNEALAIICEFHNEAKFKPRVEENVRKNNLDNGLKVSVCASLLQFADALHMESGRLNRDSFEGEVTRWIKDEPPE